MSVIGAPFLYFQKMRDREKDLEAASDDEKRRASLSLYLELEDTLEAFRDANNVCKVQHGSKTSLFVNRFLNHDMYDGMVLSAKMGLLTPDLQQDVQNVFRKIKLHNRYLEHMDKIQDKNNPYLLQHYEVLEEYEAYLKDNIPRLMNELK